MGRPPSDLDDYLDWQSRLECQKTSGLSIDDFCAREGVSRSSFYRWVGRLQNGIPESIAGEEETPVQAEAETARPNFLPVSLKASPVEIELPNGGVVRLPVGVGQAVLVEVIRVVGTLRPWRPES
jgi:transposase-like protein